MIKVNPRNFYIKRYIGHSLNNEIENAIVSTIRYTRYKRERLQRIRFSLENNLLRPILNNGVDKYRAICLPGKRKEFSGKRDNFAIVKRNPYHGLYINFWFILFYNFSFNFLFTTRKDNQL